MKHTSELFDALSVVVLIDGRPYRAVPNVFRNEFQVRDVRPLDVVVGSLLIDETRLRYRVEQCEQFIDGRAWLRVCAV